MASSRRSSKRKRTKITFLHRSSNEEKESEEVDHPTPNLPSETDLVNDENDPSQQQLETDYHPLSKKRKYSRPLYNVFGEVIPRIERLTTEEEKNEIREAVLNYCKMHQLTPIDLSCQIDTDRERKERHVGAFKEIAKDFPKRTPVSIYRLFIRMFHPFKRGLWTEEEAKNLLELVDVHGQKWTHIQFLLDRFENSCRDKWRNYETSRVGWTKEESEKLIDLVREKSLIEDETMDFRAMAKYIQEQYIEVPWSVISKLLRSEAESMGWKPRTRLSCYFRWLRMLNWLDDDSWDGEIRGDGPRKKIKRRELKNAVATARLAATAARSACERAAKAAAAVVAASVSVYTRKTSKSRKNRRRREKDILLRSGTATSKSSKSKATATPSASLGPAKVAHSINAKEQSNNKRKQRRRAENLQLECAAVTAKSAATDARSSSVKASKAATAAVAAAAALDLVNESDFNKVNDAYYAKIACAYNRMSRNKRKKSKKLKKS